MKVLRQRPLLIELAANKNVFRNKCARLKDATRLQLRLYALQNDVLGGVVVLIRADVIGSDPDLSLDVDVVVGEIMKVEEGRFRLEGEPQSFEKQHPSRCVPHGLVSQSDELGQR